MNRIKPFGLILAAFFGFFFSPVNAQFNLKAGYNISFLSDPGFNQVLSGFSEGQPYTSSFPKLSWLHGFEAGFRIKSDVHAFEATYQNGYQRLKADGDLNGGSEPYTDEISMAIHSAAIGYQVTGDVFGAGTDLQYQWYRTKVDLAQAETVFKDIQEMYALKFYLMLTLKGSGGVDAAVQLYYVLPFDTFDLDPLSLYLNQVPGPEGKKWTRFGLTLLFYNGGK